MEFDQETKDQLKKEFHDARAMYMESNRLAQSLDTDFLKVKTAFIAFVGIMFTVALVGASNQFSNNFLILLACVSFLVLLLFVADFYTAFKNYGDSLADQHKYTVLTNIRYTAALRFEKTKDKKFLKYGKDAESEADKEHELGKLMNDDKELKEILDKVSVKIKWKLNFVFWAILMLSVPALFLLSLLGFL